MNRYISLIQKQKSQNFIYSIFHTMHCPVYKSYTLYSIIYILLAHNSEQEVDYKTS